MGLFYERFIPTAKFLLSFPFLHGKIRVTRRELARGVHGVNNLEKRQELLQKVVQNLDLLLRDPFSQNLINTTWDDAALVSFTDNYHIISKDLEEKGDDLDIGLFCSLYVMLLLLICGTRRTMSEVFESDGLDHYLQGLSDSNYPDFWYRGQVNKDWGLIPSIFRHRPGRGIQHFQFSDIKYLYSQTGLDLKYQEIFGADLSKNDSYARFMAYMQHSTSFSPFIDVTESIDVAAVFASYANGDHDAFTNNDGVIFQIPVGQEIEGFDFSPDAAFQQMNVFLINQGVSAWTRINGVPLCQLSPLNLMPRYIPINAQTNDRMAYQKGHFLFFYQCYIFWGAIMIPPFKPLRFQEITIPKNAGKKAIYQGVVSRKPMYRYDLLLDPYAFFLD